MRKILSLSFLLLEVILFAGACDNTNNYGYPGKITFSNEGGYKIVSGDAIPNNIEIANYNGDGKSLPVNILNPKDSFILKNEWLTVVMSSGEPKMKLIAEPNQSKKKRVLYVMADVADDLVEIKVEQQ